MFERYGGTESAVGDAIEAVLVGECGLMSVDDLLKLIVGSRAHGALCDHFGSDALGDVTNLSGPELMQVHGVGKTTAARLLAGIEVGRRSLVPRTQGRPALSSSAQVIDFCAPQMIGFDREHFWILAVNTKNRLIKRYEVSIGILDATIVHPREVFKAAILASAGAVILVHNHPSGDPTPSSADIAMTKRLVKAGETLGIRVHDHVIIGAPNRSLSMFEEGYVTADSS